MKVRMLKASGALFMMTGATSFSKLLLQEIRIRVLGLPITAARLCAVKSGFSGTRGHDNTSLQTSANHKHAE